MHHPTAKAREIYSSRRHAWRHIYTDTRSQLILTIEHADLEKYGLASC